MALDTPNGGIIQSQTTGELSVSSLPAGDILQTTPIKNFVELTTLDANQYLLGIEDISIGNGSKITLQNFISSEISEDTGNLLTQGTDGKMLYKEAASGVQAGNYMYPQNMTVDEHGKITSVVSGSPANVPIATPSQAGIVKPDDETILISQDGTISLADTGNGYEIADIIFRILPTTDGGKHLLDGELLHGNGVFSEFVDYIEDLHEQNPQAAYFAQQKENVEIFGALTNDNGELSSFSTSNYAVSSSVFSPANNSWIMYFKIKTGSNVTTQQYICSGTGAVGFGEILITPQSRFRVQLSSNNQTTDIGYILGNHTVQANTTYWLKLEFDGTSLYKLHYSTDGTYYYQEGVLESSATVYQGAKICLGVDDYSQGRQYPFLGSIYLDDTKTYINGSAHWSGVTDGMATWWQSVRDYGVCGKFVYTQGNYYCWSNLNNNPQDIYTFTPSPQYGTTMYSLANGTLTAIGTVTNVSGDNITVAFNDTSLQSASYTRNSEQDTTLKMVRLPKVTGIVEGTIDVNALGDLVEAGLPNIKGWFSFSGTDPNSYLGGATGAFRLRRYTGAGNSHNPSVSESSWDFDFNASDYSSIYKDNATVQPQTIAGFMYIVVANSIKTPVHIEIDNIVTDLNGKAATDFTNINDTAKNLVSGLSMPSTTYIDLTVGASGTTYTAPANGWFLIKCSSIDQNSNYQAGYSTSYGARGQVVGGQWYSFGGATVPMLKGQTLTFWYETNTQERSLRFVYAEGAEGEA